MLSLFTDEDTEAWKGRLRSHSKKLTGQGLDPVLSVSEVDVLPNTPCCSIRVTSDDSKSKTDLNGHKEELRFDIRKNIQALKANTRMDKP